MRKLLKKVKESLVTAVMSITLTDVVRTLILSLLGFLARLLWKYILGM